jgi:hypothetical protein
MDPKLKTQKPQKQRGSRRKVNEDLDGFLLRFLPRFCGFCVELPDQAQS